MKDERRMIEGYVTIKEMAEKWGVTRRVQTLCSEGRIPGLQDLDTNGLSRQIQRDRLTDVLPLANTGIGEKREKTHQSDILCPSCLL